MTKLKTQGQLPFGNQRGSLLIMASFSLVAIFGMVALGIEVGRWYVVRAELSKTVDAAVLAGAKNYSNPYINTETFIQEVAVANYTPGFLGTEGTPIFSTTLEDPGKVYMTASTNVVNTVGRVLETSPETSGNLEKTTVASMGAAQLRKSEVIMVLDRSGSMYGSPIADLKTAAVGFLDNFEDTDDHNKFGLVTFASGVKVDYALDHYFHSPMVTAVNNLSANGWTNVEDALRRAAVEPGFTDQTGLPGDQLVDQFLILFSDGNPTAFRGEFTRNGTKYDAVVSQSSSTYASLYDPDRHHASIYVDGSSLRAYQSGDGLPLGVSICGGTDLSTKWEILADDTYGIHTFPSLSGSDPLQCGLNTEDLSDYVEHTAKSLSIARAQVLKEMGVKIYTIGLGAVDQSFLAAISSGEDFRYYTPNSDELQSLFQQIANDMKLRLIS